MADGRTTLFPRGPIGVWKAMLWSFRGLRAAFLTESSFRLETYLFLVFGPDRASAGPRP